MSPSPALDTTTDSFTETQISPKAGRSSGVPPKRKASPKSTSTPTSSSSKLAGKKPKSESQIQSQITTYLTNKSIWFVKVHQTGLSRNGVPDLICCHNGRLIAMEVKRPGETQTPLQKFEQEKIRKSGGVCEVVTSLEDVLLLLRGGA